VKTRLLLVAVVVAFAVGICSVAYADGYDIHKAVDVRITVWQTVLFFRVGDPITDVDLPHCQRFIQTVPKSCDHWYTDLSMEQRYLSMGLQRMTTNSYGAITHDPHMPGQYTMPLLHDYLYGKMGQARLAVPDLAQGTPVESFFDIFVAVDLEKWIAGGGVQPPENAVILITNGTSPMLPGVQVGLDPIMFTPAQGLVNPNPYTGNVWEIGDPGLTAGQETLTGTWPKINYDLYQTADNPAVPYIFGNYETGGPMISWSVNVTTFLPWPGGFQVSRPAHLQQLTVDEEDNIYWREAFEPYRVISVDKNGALRWAQDVTFASPNDVSIGDPGAGMANRTSPTPVIGKDYVFACSEAHAVPTPNKGDGWAMAIDKATGKTAWFTPLIPNNGPYGSVDRLHGANCSPVLYNDKLYIVGGLAEDNKTTDKIVTVYVLSATTGAILAQTDLPCLARPGYWGPNWDNVNTTPTFVPNLFDDVLGKHALVFSAIRTDPADPAPGIYCIQSDETGAAPVLSMRWTATAVGPVLYSRPMYMPNNTNGPRFFFKSWGDWGADSAMYDALTGALVWQCAPGKDSLGFGDGGGQARDDPNAVYGRGTGGTASTWKWVDNGPTFTRSVWSTSGGKPTESWGPGCIIGNAGDSPPNPKGVLIGQRRELGAAKLRGLDAVDLGNPGCLLRTLWAYGFTAAELRSGVSPLSDGRLVQFDANQVLYCLTVQPNVPGGSIGDAKKNWVNGDPVALGPRAVTLAPTLGGQRWGFFYEEEGSRSSGIRVEPQAPDNLVVNDVVAVSGTMATTPAGEKYIANAVFPLPVFSGEIKPLGVNNRAVQEDALIVGELVTTTGEVKDGGDGTYFTINDGYCGAGGAPFDTTVLVAGDPIGPPGVGLKVAVTGTVSMGFNPASLAPERVIIYRSFQVLAPPIPPNVWSTGFEQATYSLGPLNGQDSWVVTLRQTAQATIVGAPNPVIGEQALRLDAPSAIVDPADPTKVITDDATCVRPSPTGANPVSYVVIRMKIWRDPGQTEYPAGSGEWHPNIWFNNLWWTNENATWNIYGLQWDSNLATMPFGWAGGAGSSPTVTGRYAELVLYCDFVNHIMSSWYDGAMVDSMIPLNPAVTTWPEIVIEYERTNPGGVPGTYGWPAYIDELSVGWAP